MKKLIVALAVATVALAGCIKVSTTPPTDLPAYVKIMPGGQQVMTMDVGPLKAEVYQTPSSSDDVFAFYRAQAQTDGLAETPSQQQPTSSDQKQVTFADNAAGRMLVVVTQPQSGQTLVTLTYRPVAAQAPANATS